MFACFCMYIIFIVHSLKNNNSNNNNNKTKKKKRDKFGHNLFSPFSTNFPLLYSLKTSENPRFSDVYRGCRRGTLVENGLKDNTTYIEFFYKNSYMKISRLKKSIM